MIHLRPEIFTLAPNFHRGLVIASSLSNTGESPELQKLLEKAEAETKTLENPILLPSVTAWDEVHRSFGSNPNKFSPAHKNLLKRVHRPDGRLPFISRVVAIMNIASLRLQTPVGGDDLDRMLSFGPNLELRLAEGDESFLPLGKEAKEESPEHGEVIYVSGETVMCRRWNWRNSGQTLITPETSRMIMNIDCLGENAAGLAREGAELVGSLLEEFCGAKVEHHLLHANEPRLTL